MPELTFVLAGEANNDAAAALATALAADDGVNAAIKLVLALSDVERRVIDPISLAALIVSIPSAALAVADIVDRIRKRRKAQAVVGTTQHLRSERPIETYLLATDQTQHVVADLDPDKLLDLVAEMEHRPAQ